MDINHVNLDGTGGVAEMLNITKVLLVQGYTEEDIEKILW